jgi:hypothetical protein
MTKIGDGTVVSESANHDSGIVMYEDIGESSASVDLDGVTHATILSASTTQNIIGNLISENKDITGSRNINEIQNLPGVYINEYPKSNYEKNSEIVLSTHSPVELHVYDSLGRHTGEINSPAGAEDIFVSYEENIPGSSYKRTGNDYSPERYVSLKAQKDGMFRVEIKGTDTGEFSYRIERKENGEVVDSVEYSGLPATPVMLASTHLSFNTMGSGMSLASTSELLNLDIDSDGVIEASVKPNQEPDPKLFLDLIKKTLDKLGTKDSRVKELLKKINRIGNLLEQGKPELAENKLNSLYVQVGHKKLGQAGESNRKDIVDSIERYLLQFK